MPSVIRRQVQGWENQEKKDRERRAKNGIRGNEEERRSKGRSRRESHYREGGRGETTATSPYRGTVRQLDRPDNVAKKA